MFTPPQRRSHRCDLFPDRHPTQQLQILMFETRLAARRAAAVNLAHDATGLALRTPTRENAFRLARSKQEFIDYWEISTPDTQQSLDAAGGTLDFNQQRAFGP
ncbi:MAG: hypothetical protein HQK81_02155 [Desulfovibrionaceae bacterium]|nr:hypothetical protein [Desulfovibrionaceae bacterium]MBF0512847.1 hypothetical protein [Desulfovibrionaceae bacterium]